MEEAKKNEIIFKSKEPLHVAIFMAFMFILACLITSILAYFSLVNHQITASIIFIIFFVLSLIGFIHSIISVANKKIIKVSDDLIVFKYSLPFKEDIKLNIKDCIGAFPYTRLDFMPTMGGLITTKGVFLKFKDNYVLKLSGRSTEAMRTSFSNFSNLYKILESMQVKNFNNNPNDIINKTKVLRGIDTLIHPSNPKKLANQAFQKGEYKLTYDYNFS